MDIKRQTLKHFLAALAYRTQKALRDAPDTFADFRAKPGVRTPHEILSHMTGVITYAATFLVGGESFPEKKPSFREEIDRFHEALENLGNLLNGDKPIKGTTPDRILQGPLSDAMTHAGQLILLRRLYGSPVPPENFIKAAINADNLGPKQPDPVSPDREWTVPDE